ncbi:MAG: zinc ribbon domain-containing protein, partial [Candidatus Hodarchaeota archaeon]
FRSKQILGINDAIPPHVRQNISTGEEIISTFRGSYSRKSKSSPKNWSNCLMILTTEKLLIDSEKKKAIEKLLLSNVLSVERTKVNKIKIFYSPRESSSEDIIKLEIEKNKGEKKEEFTNRMEEISQNIEVFYDSAEEPSDSEDKGISIIPDLIIKPTSPIGVPPQAKEVKEAKTIVRGRQFCHNCGAKLPSGGKFCAACGTEVN